MKKRNILKGIIIFILSFSLTLSLTGCTGIGGVLSGALWQNPLNSGDDPFGLGQNTSGNNGRGNFLNTIDPFSVNARRGSVMALKQDGEVEIARVRKEKTESMGEPGTWTIFVYLCGSDLETDSGFASVDIDEMVSGSKGGGVTYVVETGGAFEWMHDKVNADRLCRFLIKDGNLERVDTQPLSSMADSSTLADFLKWGVKNYPAENMGVVIWNHGGGSITGVCFDQLFDNDSLTLGEMDSAFSDVYSTMTDNFEFIGFDACLMATVECAHVLANYANYMYASEESEYGTGWDFEEMGAYLLKNKGVDGASLGKVVCDSVYSGSELYGEEDDSTMSVVDLSKIDTFISKFNTFAQKLYEATDGKNNEDMFSKVARAINSCENFGGNNFFEGYANMVDLGGLISSVGDYIGDTSDARGALDDMVIYMKNGRNHRKASGLSTYYPLMIEGSEELSIFGSAAISPYYFDFVSRSAYANANRGSFDGYDDLDFLNLWQNSQTEDAGDETAFDGAYDYYDEFEQTGESSNISFDRKPSFDRDGNYSFRLSKEGLLNTLSIEGNVFQVDYEENYLVACGVTADLIIDWNTGEVSDSFDGSWFSLPDGQNLTVEIQSQNDGYDIYASPVMLNGERTNLLFIHDYEQGEVYIYGVWDGLDDYGASSRRNGTLKKGDVIIPIADAFSLSDYGEETVYYGEEYVYDGNDDLIYALMPDGDYAFNFTIYDIYGDYYDTEIVKFTVEGSDVYYSYFE